MYLVFDTETCGLPANYKAPFTDHANWPRMVSLSWQLHDITGELAESKHLIIKPNGYVIPAASTQVHGISTEYAMEHGIDISQALALFDLSLDKATTLVAHNIAFDSCILGAEYDRLGLESAFFSRRMLCTMEMGVPVVRIPGKYGYKWPTLDQLYRHLFKEGFEGAHNSAADTAACARCFFELKKLAKS